MKLITVVGARPQFIKAAAVSRSINTWNQKSEDLKIEEVIIHTGQHYDKCMSDVFFTEMRIPKPYMNLGVGSGNHGYQTALILKKLEEAYLQEKPDLVMVYGDTNSTLAGALAASKLLIPIVHVEAGLRSFDKRMPEEQNRIMTDHLSTLLCCPTKNAIENLAREGFVIDGKAENGKPVIENTGDVMFDCVLYYRKLANDNNLQTTICDMTAEDIEGPFILSTVHRQENTDDFCRLSSILSALSRIAKTIKVVLPLHPRTKKIIADSRELKELVTNICIIEPVSYFQMIALEQNCSLIITDSGGVQKEAFFFQKPCVTIRDQTEWIETAQSGWNKVVGADYDRILAGVELGLDFDQKAGRAPFSDTDFQNDSFGTGNSADIIVSKILNVF